MKNSDFKETIERLRKLDARTRGDLLDVADDYLKKTGKAELLEKIVAKTADYGYSLTFKEIHAMRWYPVAMEIALFFSMIEILGWEEKDIKEFGKSFVKISFIERILAKYFIAVEKTYQQAPVIWRRHMDSGELETHEFNKEKKYCVLRLKGLDLHPLYCIFLAGMFEGMADFITGSKINRCQESQCVFRGDDYHEFIVSWE